MAIPISTPILIEQMQMQTPDANQKGSVRPVDAVKLGTSSKAKDQVSLGEEWSEDRSPIIQNINQYVVLSHKMDSLADDFRRLMKDELEQDQNFQSAIKRDSSLMEMETAFNDFSGVDLASQTANTDSIANALGGFSEKLAAERKSKLRDNVINSGKRRREAQAVEFERRSVAIQESKKVLEEKLARILNPKRDVVVAAAENDEAQQAAMPKPKPDLALLKANKISKNPKPDAAREKVNDQEHTRYMEAFKSKAPKKVVPVF